MGIPRILALCNVHFDLRIHITLMYIKFLFYSRELATFPTLPNLVSVENDATLAKSACAVGYAHRRRIEVYTQCSSIMDIAVKQLVAVSTFLLLL